MHMALAAGAGEVRAIATGDPWRLAGLNDARFHLHVLREWWTGGACADIAGITRDADALVILAYTPPAGGQSVEGWIEHELTINAIGAIRVTAACSRADTRVVFTSSADVYGPYHRQPVTESVVPGPTSPYAVAKLTAEAGVRLAAGPAGSVSLRLATVFGPGENGPRAIPSFTRALLTGRRPRLDAAGADERDYVHVDDVAAAVINGCLLDEPPLGPLNIGSGQGRRTADVLSAVARVLAVEPEADLPPVDRAAGRLVLDTSRAANILGFQPSLEFERLVGVEIEWLRRHHATTVSQRFTTPVAKGLDPI